MQHFIQLLEKLVVSDNVIRSNAENDYRNMQLEGGDNLSLALLYVIQNSGVPDHLRQLAAVLLRRYLIEENDGSVYQEMSKAG